MDKIDKKNSVLTLVVYTLGPPDVALSVLRYRATAQSLGWEIVHGQNDAGVIYPERVHQADAVLVQRDFPQMFSAYLQIVQEANEVGIPILYDIDDLLIALPVDHPHVDIYKDSVGGILYAILTADRLIVSTPLLRDIFQPLQPRISVWETRLPDTLWKITPPQLSAENSPLRIGYMGGTSHGPDIGMLISPLCQFLKNSKQQVELHFWGCTPPDELARCTQTIYHPIVQNYAGFAAEFSSNTQIDIWLAPLQPTLFNRCKSAIKFWEYSAVGGVGIYSDIEPYRSVVRHGENGFLADTPESWIKALTILANDPIIRLQLAQNAQHQLQEDGCISTHLQAWKDICITSTPYEQEDTSLFVQSMLRFSQQVQQQLNTYSDDVLILRQQNKYLEIRSRQLDKIYGSWWWRTWQRLKRVACLDFSSSPPFKPSQL